MCDISNGITAELFLYLIQQGKKGCLKSNIRKHIAVNIIFKFILEGVIYMGSVTTNPWLISIINMTIVFGVLIALGVLMSMIQLVDPTRNKR